MKKSKTTTLFISLAGPALQHVVSFRHQHRLCHTRLTRISSKPADRIWQEMFTKNICDFKISFTRLFDSPSDNFNDGMDTRTIRYAADEVKNSAGDCTDSNNVSFPEPTVPTSTIYDDSSSGMKLTKDNIDIANNSLNSTNSTTVSLIEGNNNQSQEIYLDAASTILKGDTNSDSDEGQSLAVAPNKLMQFFKDESPPVAVLLLNLVAIIWGSQHAIIKTVVDDSDPAAFTFLRFTLASVLASPYLPGAKQTARNKLSSKPDGDNDRRHTEIDLWKPWRWGVEMGIWMFLGFSLQAIGLQTTTAQRSGFLLYLNVKFVPFFAKILLDRQISIWTWVSAIAAFSGTALLALDGQSLGLNIGDIWSVMAAAASAMFILRLERASFEVPKSSELNATSLIIVAMLSGVWLLLGNSDQEITVEVMETVFTHPLELLYLGGVSTALANFIQTKAQKYVPAERASIIYSLDPVYGALFSYLILGETLGGPQAYVGATIIFVAAATNSLLQFSNAKDKSK